ncbi:MAG TPA: helix-turn-helix transcriptional regulator [Solirubrobacterales bacterium]|nr:helix-turn-helix transcriptional regulator [Solirubrobacterales bacterium]
MTRASEPQPEIGKAIRTLREDQGITQEGLAYEAGLTVGTLSQLERGLSNPSLGTLKKIAVALGMSASALVKAAEK